MNFYIETWNLKISVELGKTVVNGGSVMVLGTTTVLEHFLPWMSLDLRLGSLLIKEEPEGDS